MKIYPNPLVLGGNRRKTRRKRKSKRKSKSKRKNKSKKYIA